MSKDLIELGSGSGQLQLHVIPSAAGRNDSTGRILLHPHCRRRLRLPADRLLQNAQRDADSEHPAHLPAAQRDAVPPEKRMPPRFRPHQNVLRTEGAMESDAGEALPAGRRLQKRPHGHSAALLAQ